MIGARFAKPNWHLVSVGVRFGMVPLWTVLNYGIGWFGDDNNDNFHPLFPQSLFFNGWRRTMDGSVFEREEWSGSHEFWEISLKIMTLEQRAFLLFKQVESDWTCNLNLPSSTNPLSLYSVLKSQTVPVPDQFGTVQRTMLGVCSVELANNAHCFIFLTDYPHVQTKIK